MSVNMAFFSIVHQSNYIQNIIHLKTIRKYEMVEYINNLLFHDYMSRIPLKRLQNFLDSFWRWGIDPALFHVGFIYLKHDHVLICACTLKIFFSQGVIVTRASVR